MGEQLKVGQTPTFFINGIYVGSHARTDDTTVKEKWNGLASFFGWLMLGNCPPTASYGGWGSYFAIAAKNYELPEVIYRIGTDRTGAYTHYEQKRTRHRWRYSDVRNAPVYKTTHVTKDYAVGFWRKRPYRALDQLTLEVAQGEVFGFLGPNGAGKTTTLKLLMRLVFPTSGRAEILGKPAGGRHRRAAPCRLPS